MLNDSTLQVMASGQAKNSALGQQRIARVKSYLKDKGVKTTQVRAAAGGAQSRAASADVLALKAYTRDPAAIEQRFNAQNPLSVQISQRVFQKGDNKVVDELMTKGPGTYNVEKDGRYYTVIIDKTLPAGPKTLAEARGQATSDYQTYLEKEWITQMRNARPVKVNEAEVSKLVTK
jgi:peptidyl-prolyl cis-trans isomerase SurA